MSVCPAAPGSTLNPATGAVFDVERETSLRRYLQLIDSLCNTPAAVAALAEACKSADQMAPVRSVDQSLMAYSRLNDLDGEPQHRSLIELTRSLDGSILSMLVRYVAGVKLGYLQLSAAASAAFDCLIAQQQPGGAFLPHDSHVSPEARWYEELVTLHAIGSYAARVNSPAVDAAVRRCAEFHLLETQPDHATAEPWGLLAFIRYAPSLADQVLHAMSMQYAGGIRGIPLLILRDVRYGLLQLVSDAKPADK